MSGKWKAYETCSESKISSIILFSSSIRIRIQYTALEYNSYEPASHLIGAPKAIANFKHTLKRKQKEVRAAGQIEDPTDDDETAPA